ncbi:isopeptide-forming domain-containing fimbrial protein, partial [Bacillus sp. JCM 19034]|uniref:isopeptide-forming domain-containing fimbrial protein n=1 Tax=Bacillus sp. JCM 19034 TaxID=1481928 RepID=UPI000A9D2F55
MTIRDEIPEGLEYVEGTLRVDGEAVTDEEDDDAGHYVDGEIFVEFGDVTDTDWHTVTFQVVVGEGQASQDIENIATVDGDNIDDPDKPSHEVNVYPRIPDLDSEKTSRIVEKAEGNTNEEAFQVGDTIEYTIQSRNTISDSVVENMVISDELPEGLTYVEGSLEVSHEGTANIEDGNITAEFGDVTDTEWRTITFQATIDAGQSGETIENTATVDGDNVDDPERPENEIIVDPKEPNLESEKTSEIFEKAEGNTHEEAFQVGDTIEYTIQSRNTVSDSIVENMVISDELPEGLTYVEGSLEVSHEGTANIEDGIITAEFGNVFDTEWRTVTFQVTIDAGQSGETIENTATVDGDNIDDPDTPENEIIVDPKEPNLASEKISEIYDKAEGNTNEDHPEVGDILTYTIQTRNTIEDSLVTNLTIRDEIPAGLEYVEGTLTVDGEAVT